MRAPPEARGAPQLIVSPLRRLISKNNATIRDVGPPETVLGSVGAFITGAPQRPDPAHPFSRRHGSEQQR